MVLAYVVLFLPYTVQYVTSSFTQISDSLMAAGQVFGGSPAYILRRITLPLIRQGDRKSTRLNSSHMPKSRMPSSA